MIILFATGEGSHTGEVAEAAGGAGSRRTEKLHAPWPRHHTEGERLAVREQELV
jgi:hypothetical protein